MIGTRRVAIVETPHLCGRIFWIFWIFGHGPAPLWQYLLDLWERSRTSVAVSLETAPLLSREWCLAFISYQ